MAETKIPALEAAREEEDAWFRTLPTSRLIAMAQRADQNRVNAEAKFRAKAQRLYDLARKLAIERGEHIGDDGI